MSRRLFLGGVVGAGVLPLATSAGAQTGSSVSIYRLNSDWGAGDPGCVPNRGQSECGGCFACVRHSENKLFATAAAADAGRAHSGCKCRVEVAFAVDPSTGDTLFAGEGSVDRRTAGVNEILAASSVPPADAQSPGGSLALTGGPLVPLAIVGASALAAGAALQRAARAPARSPSPRE